MTLQNPAEIDSRAATAAYLVDQNGVPLAGGQGVQAAASDARSTSQLGQLVDSRVQGYNGTTWDRLRTAVSDALASTGLLAVGNMLWNGTTWDRARSKGTGWQGVALVRSSDGTEVTSGPATDGDGGTGSKLYAHAHNDLFNGATWDRQRGNTEGTLLASASRTVTTNSPDQVNYNARSLKVILDVSVIGTGSITVAVQGKDPISGNYYTLLTGVAAVGNGTVVYDVAPGIADAANVAAGKPVPRTFRVAVTANNANPVTYSVAYALGV